MTTRPVIPRRGDPITAEFFDRLVDYIDAAAAIAAGPGLTVINAGGRRTIALATGAVREVPAWITAAPPPGVPLPAASCVYSARAYPPHADTYAVSDAAPKYGRVVPLSGAAPYVLPAKVNDLCKLVVREDPSQSAEPGALLVELWVLSETPNYQERCPT